MPLVTEPPDIFLNGIDELLALFFWICIVEAEMTLPPELLCQTEVDGDRLGMTDMQKTVGLWRKAGDHSADAPRIEVVLNLCSQKITAQFCGHRKAPGASPKNRRVL